MFVIVGLLDFEAVCYCLCYAFIVISANKIVFVGDEGRYQTYFYCNLSNTNNVIIAQSYKAKIVSNSNTKN